MKKVLTFSIIVLLLIGTVATAQTNTTSSQASTSSHQNAPILPFSQKPEVALTKPEPPPTLMKDLLKVFPLEDRIEFIDSIALLDGRIVSSGYISLTRTQEMDFVNKQIETLAHIQTNKTFAEKQRKEIFKLHNLVSPIPDKLRNEFLDNLMYKNAMIVSAYIDGLKKKMKDDMIAALLKDIFPLGDKTSSPKNKIRCSDGICYDAICAANHATSEPPYIYKPGWACSATCGEPLKN